MPETPDNETLEFDPATGRWTRIYSAVVISAVATVGLLYIFSKYYSG